jgi:hypothetical protein
VCVFSIVFSIAFYYSLSRGIITAPSMCVCVFVVRLYVHLHCGPTPSWLFLFFVYFGLIYPTLLCPRKYVRHHLQFDGLFCCWAQNVEGKEENICCLFGFDIPVTSSYISACSSYVFLFCPRSSFDFATSPRAYIVPVLLEGRGGGGHANPSRTLCHFEHSYLFVFPCLPPAHSSTAFER